MTTEELTVLKSAIALIVLAVALFYILKPKPRPCKDCRKEGALQIPCNKHHMGRFGGYGR